MCRTGYVIILSFIILSVIILNVITLSFVILSIIEPALHSLKLFQNRIQPQNLTVFVARVDGPLPIDPPSG